jgi:hypothetical protein
MTGILILCIIAILDITLLILYWKKKIKGSLGIKTSNIIKIIHYFGLIICCVVAWSYLSYGIGLRGLWTTRIIIILTFTIGIFFIFVSNQAALNTFEKVYFRLFSFIPALTTALSLIVWIAGVIIISIFLRVFNPAEKTFYEDDKLRVQSTFQSVMLKPQIDVFEKKLIFEKYLKKLDLPAAEIDSITISYDADSTRIKVYGLFRNDDNTWTQCVYATPLDGTFNP